MKTLSCLLLLVVCMFGHVAYAAERQWISWPEELRNSGKDLGIEEIHVKVTCGEIGSVLNVPSDWNFEVVRPISGVAELHASAGHGTSHLQDLRSLEGIIGVVIDEPKCFNVSAKVVAFKAEYELPHEKFTLRKRPNISFQQTCACGAVR